MGRYRKKPVEIEAIRLIQLPFDGSTFDTQAVLDFVHPDQVVDSAELAAFTPDAHILNGAGVNIGQGPFVLHLWNTEERQYIGVPIGHWIIRGLAGELYPCSPDVFAASYEPVD